MNKKGVFRNILMQKIFHFVVGIGFKRNLYQKSNNLAQIFSLESDVLKIYIFVYLAVPGLVAACKIKFSLT